MGVGCFCSPHFLQLSIQSSRYFSSLDATASEALLHRSLCSMHPASLQRDEIKEQHAWASFMLNATLFVRTSKQSSLANTHVLIYLKWFNVCSRNFWRLNSKGTVSMSVVGVAFLVTLCYYSLRISNISYAFNSFMIRLYQKRRIYRYRVAILFVEYQFLVF